MSCKLSSTSQDLLPLQTIPLSYLQIPCQVEDSADIWDGNHIGGVQGKTLNYVWCHLWRSARSNRVNVCLLSLRFSRLEERTRTGQSGNGLRPKHRLQSYLHKPSFLFTALKAMFEKRNIRSHAFEQNEIVSIRINTSLAWHCLWFPSLELEASQ